MSAGMLPTSHVPLSSEIIAEIATRARNALGGIAPAQSGIAESSWFWVNAKRTDGGRTLPEYYLVYFLLVDLLAFPATGQDEKVAWSVPISFGGKTFVIEHRKMGLGIFCPNPKHSELEASDIARRIRSACKRAIGYFRELAMRGVVQGQLNIANLHEDLYGRYLFLQSMHGESVSNLERLHAIRSGRAKDTSNQMARPGDYFELGRQCDWLSRSVFEAFFAWTEHVFVHLAAMRGVVQNGEALLELTGAEWADKFKAAFPITESPWKAHFDALLTVRQEHRNLTTHGAFGKDGRAFTFHSGAGAVPVRLDDSTLNGVTIVPRAKQPSQEQGLAILRDFLDSLSSGKTREYLKYLESGLPTILTLAARGDYRAAAQASQMDDLIEYWGRARDDAANMDW